MTVNIEKIESLIQKFYHTTRYSKKRKFLTNALKLGAILDFNYQKLNGEIKSYTIIYNPDYTYDIPPTNSDFIYLFDTHTEIFKHFKLLRITDIEFSLIET